MSFVRLERLLPVRLWRSRTNWADGALSIPLGQVSVKDDNGQKASYRSFFVVFLPEPQKADLEKLNLPPIW